MNQICLKGPIFHCVYTSHKTFAINIQCTAVRALQKLVWSTYFHAVWNYSCM